MKEMLLNNLSQNVHFVTTSIVHLTEMGVLYPRMQDFFKNVFK